MLVHGEGDWAGRPFKLRPWQRAMIYRAYELEPDGSRRYRRVVWGLPKGNGKTELAAAVGTAELAGPVICAGFKDGRPIAVERRSPNIPVAATSLDQADLLFGAARQMIAGGPLRPFCELYDEEILLKGRPGRFFRTAAVSASNDGGRPSFLCGDELHEWTGRKERVHLVLSGNVAKRAESWELDISTAGWDRNTLLGRLYTHGKRVLEGVEEDRQLLFHWREPSFEVDLSNPDQVRRAVLETNPAAGDFLPVENVLRRLREIPEHEFRRYHLNQWAQPPERWIPAELWAACARPGQRIPDGVRVVLALDGSFNRDSTALWAATVEAVPHFELLGAWERPEQAPPDWKIDREQIMTAIETALVRFQVAVLGYDDTFGRLWAVDMEGLQAKGVTVAEWPTRSLARMGPAAGGFYGRLKDRKLTHDGSPEAARHVANCVAKVTRWGIVPVKSSPDSAERIDVAVAAIVADDLVQRQLGDPGGPWVLAAID